MNPDQALTVLGPKTRAVIYLILITASAILTPLMAFGVLPSLYGSIVLSLIGVFGGTTALANVRRPQTRPEYVGDHEAQAEPPAPFGE